MTDDASEPGQRERLLGLIVEHCLAHGVAELTLRRLADDIGSNNRMLLYYFGSREELIDTALLGAIDRFPLIGTAIDRIDDPSTPLDARLATAWRRITHPDNMAFIRLFFEVFGLAAHNPERYKRYLDNVGREWTEQIGASIAAEGLGRTEANDLAREIVALWRGLQFDLLSTDDRSGIDRAHDAAAASIAARSRNIE